MNAKERVHAALRREPVDRVPIWMWYHPQTSARLARFLELPPALVPAALGDDIRQTWVGNNHAMEGVIHERDGQTHIDDWGVEWVRGGDFNQIRTSPLSNATPADIAAYGYPYDCIDKLLKNMALVMEESDRFFVGCDISPCLFELVCRLRGMEHALLDIAASPALFAKMLAQAADFSVALAEAACGALSLDWLWTGDDVGSQNGMTMSPQCWRDLIKPHLARIFAVGKSHGAWVAYHSCGAVRPIIPDLIEMGLDVLNPIQRNCPGMEPAELKQEYGSSLSFFGGVDTQQLLPRGSASEVHRATATLLEKMTAGGGGYILGASHTVPPETPLENIFAMYAAAGVTQDEIRDRAADLRATSAAAGG